MPSDVLLCAGYAWLFVGALRDRTKFQKRVKRKRKGNRSRVGECAFLSARACTRFLTRSLLREKAHVPARAPARKARAGTRTQKRSAHMAIEQACKYVEDGYT
jgi:hypothetical protein